MSIRACVVFLLSLVFALAMVPAQPQESTTPNNRGAVSGLEALAALEPIDTHTHVAKGDAEFYAMLDRVHMHILDILLVDDQEAYRKSLSTQRRGGDGREPRACRAIYQF